MANGKHHLHSGGEWRQCHGQHKVVCQIRSVTYFLRVKEGGKVVSVRSCSKLRVSLTS